MEPAFTTTFTHSLDQGSVGPCLVVERVRRATATVFESSRQPGTLNIRFPSPTQPACVDADFRAFASALLSSLPGLPFFVFGGESWQTRDLFLATLGNVAAAATSEGTTTVRFLLSEAHRHLHDQFEALIAHGVTEDEAITEMSRLAEMLGMTSRDWL